MPIERVCRICDKVVKRSPSKNRKLCFCSKEHEWVWKRSKEGREYHSKAGYSQIRDYQYLEGIKH